MNPILSAACQAWLAAAIFRARRERAKRYTYGDQWGDIVADGSGHPIVEADYIAREGKKPLTNNMIRQIVKIVVGRYRSLCDDNKVYDPSAQPVDFITPNDLAELDCRMLEEFLISGVAIQRIVSESRPYGAGLWIDNVDPRMFFVNRFRDPRGHDIELIGMLHDFSLAEIVARFAPHNSPLAERLARVYTPDASRGFFSSAGELGLPAIGAENFFISSEGRCRVIEVWTLDCRTKTDRRRRREIEFVWHCRWFAPDGTVLASYDSPFAHHSHPFAVKFYPLTDGEVHSFVEDVIEQQRCINRLIVLIDHVIGASAKGVLLFPDDQKIKSVSWQDISDTWAKANGVIPISGRGTHLPQQVVSSTSDLGAYNLLSLQMKLFDNISGVTDAIAGRDISPAIGNQRYQTQLQNSAIGISDLIETFAAFRRLRDQKALNI